MQPLIHRVFAQAKISRLGPNESYLDPDQCKNKKFGPSPTQFLQKLRILQSNKDSLKMNVVRIKGKGCLKTS